MGKLPGHCICWVVCTFLAALFLTETKAEEFSTTNRDYLAHFWAAAEGGQRPVTVVSFGDSMADSYQSITYSLINSLTYRLGVAGYSLDNYANATEYRLTNGAQLVVGPTQFWFTDHYRLPSGGGLWWEAQASSGGVYSDEVGVFWVAQPTGGSMTFSVSNGAGPWTPLLTLNGYAAVAKGQYTNVLLAADWHRIRVDSVTGTNYVIGPQLLLQATNGVHVVFMDKGGIAIRDMTNVPSAIRTPILAALSPDLLIWHMKEDGTAVTSNRLITCEEWWSNAVPSCDVVYIGTPYVSVDTNPATAVTVSQNRLVRDIALTYHRAYEDLMNPSVSYPWMVSQGFMTDGTHENYIGGKYLADIMWNDLGFFALNVPRKLTLKFSGQKLTATYPTVTGVYYTLETCTNLANWSPIVSVPGSGLNLSTNVPAASRSAFFRLRLSPN